MSAKSLTVLFAPLDGVGHINACHGIADALRERGHRCVFAIDIAYRGKLKRYGFEELVLEQPKSADRGDSGLDIWEEFVYKYKDVYRKSPIEIAGTSTVVAFGIMFDRYKAIDSQYKHILCELKPDLIIIDSYIGSPTLTHAGIPWIRLCSAGVQMFYHNDKIPPGCSGLPLNGDQKEWKEFRIKYDEIYRDLHQRISQWFTSVGAPALPSNNGNVLHPESPYLNIYLYPKELDYDEIQPMPANWFRIDGTVRTTDDTFTIPDHLSQRSGKLIFFTIGSYGSSNLDLMIRLTEILGKSEHRFIVSKGPLHHRYELPVNMYGQQFVPQMAVLPLVSLVIAHGGNNTLLEALYFGKPSLILPMAADQLDNAQRVAETGLGARLNPYHSTEEELLSTVDKLVNDSELAKRCQSIGERIRNANNKQIVAEKIENILTLNK